jgi:hypothetical protein
VVASKFVDPERWLTIYCAATLSAGGHWRELIPAEP